MSDPRLRKIKIQTGVVKRLGKEREVNFKEIAQQEKRIQKYKDEGRDEYDVKKQYEVLEECQMMVPNTQARLEKAHGELTKLLEDEADLCDAQEYKDAQAMLQTVTVAHSQ